jgi:mannose-6-phosphate isomerase-like protein (cupin superfamily)
VTTTLTTLTKKSVDTPDEVREVPGGRIDIVRVADLEFARSVFQPGWSWSGAVKPLAGTESCEYPHRVFVASGAIRVRMDDGTEIDAAAGDVLAVPPGHDGWVLGDEPCVMYDFGGEDADYATPAT